jgi:hypothetical protein
VQLVPPPHRCGDGRDEGEEATRRVGILGDPLRALDRLGNVGDHAPAPAPYLVTEEAEAPGAAGTDGAFRDDPALRSYAVPDRSHLDYEAPLRDVHLERGVVEVAPRTPVDEG